MFSAGCLTKEFKLMNRRPLSFIIIALFLLLAGAVIPFLMFIRVLESTFFVNFAAYVLSVAGLFLGVLGIAMFVGDARSKRDDWHDY